MRQTFDETTDPSFGPRHVPLIRRAMADSGLDGFVVPHEDEHQNEYLPAANDRLAWATGFTGSAGAAVILQDRAAVFVDGRYVLQVRDQVDGGLFSIGDPHVSQGDGEISGTAIESSLNVLFQIVLRKDFHFASPLLETPKWWIVHGFDENLNVASKNAAKEMITLLNEHVGLSKDDAYSLMSVAGDLCITQVVDGRQGAHVRIPRGIFPSKKGG